MAFIFRYKYYLLFLLLVLIGFYLRFHAINVTQEFGWDQARDAWKVRDLLRGQLVLDGPITGAGRIPIGPFYFYFLAPFFYFTNLDPIASNYSVMIAYLINIGVFYFVSKKLFSEKIAVVSSTLYVFSFYLIHQSQIQYNVSLVPAVSILLYYGIYQLYQKKYYWFPILAALSGLFFHLHFTFLFIPPIIALSLIFFKDWKQSIKYIIPSFFFYVLFFIPTIIFDVQGAHGEAYRIKDFNSSYTQSFHLRFFFFRLPQSLVQFEALLFFKQLAFLKYIIPFVFFILTAVEKDKKLRQLGLLMIPWFAVPVIGFTLYKGSISDYYFLLHMPLVIYMIVYIMYRLININRPIFITLFSIYWLYYGFYNVKALLELPTDKGIDHQRIAAREQITKYGAISYSEGDIKAYFYQIWQDQGNKNKEVKRY
jgi:4-amino-4-deoxy-L-arabinose transferase-like glycosyltransferase